MNNKLTKNQITVLLTSWIAFILGVVFNIVAIYLSWETAIIETINNPKSVSINGYLFVSSVFFLVAVITTLIAKKKYGLSSTIPYWGTILFFLFSLLLLLYRVIDIFQS